MNAGLREMIPNWFRQGETDMADDEIPPPPPVAMLPAPQREMTEDERRLKVIADAHNYVEQIKHERAADARKIERLEGEKAELETKLKQEERKSGLLELDVAQHVNTIATLQSEVIEHKRLLDLLRDINAKSTAAFARLDIKGTKKERKPRAKNGKKRKATHYRETGKTQLKRLKKLGSL